MQTGSADCTAKVNIQNHEAAAKGNSNADIDAISAPSSGSFMLVSDVDSMVVDGISTFNDNSGTFANTSVAKLAEADEQACMGGSGAGKYVHLEYLEWMGRDILHSEKEEGDINCFNCQRMLGSWAWAPHPRHTLDGRVEAPLFRVLKHSVQLMGIPLDSTPLGTPRTPRPGSCIGGASESATESTCTPLSYGDIDSS